MFVLGESFKPIVMFAGEARSPPKSEAPEICSTLGKAPYYPNPKITAVKSFIVQAPGVNVIEKLEQILFG